MAHSVTRRGFFLLFESVLEIEKRSVIFCTSVIVLRFLFSYHRFHLTLWDPLNYLSLCLTFFSFSEKVKL